MKARDSETLQQENKRARQRTTALRESWKRATKKFVFSDGKRRWELQTKTKEGAKRQIQTKFRLAADITLGVNERLKGEWDALSADQRKPYGAYKGYKTFSARRKKELRSNSAWLNEYSKWKDVFARLKGTQEEHYSKISQTLNLEAK